MREKIGPIATPDFIQNAPALPKTRSGKTRLAPLLTNILLLLCNICLLFSDPFREDHEANPPADRPQWEGPGRPFIPGWSQGGGGVVQPEVWSCSLNGHPRLHAMKRYKSIKQSQTAGSGSECLCALFGTEWKGRDIRAFKMIVLCEENINMNLNMID